MSGVNLCRMFTMFTVVKQISPAGGGTAEPAGVTNSDDLKERGSHDMKVKL